MMGKPMDELKQLIESLRHELTDELSTIKQQITNNDKKLDSLDSKFTKVFKRIDELSKAVDDASTTAEDALKSTKQNEANINKLSKSMDSFNNKYDKLEKDNSANIVRVHVLEKKLEDQVNRSSRKTIVVRGVKEGDKESWDDTRTVLAKEISNVASITEKEASCMMERVHRSRPNPHKQGKRDIVAAFFDWNDSEFVMRKFRDAAKKGQVKGIFVDQKYGPITTMRRNHALLQRKKLIVDKVITNGYVAYPAKLMVKKSKTDKNFVLYEDYSEMIIDS